MDVPIRRVHVPDVESPRTSAAEAMARADRCGAIEETLEPEM